MKRSFIIVFACLVSLAGCNGQRSPVPKANPGETGAITAPDTSEASAPSLSAGQGEGPATHDAQLPAINDSDVIEIKEKMFIAQTNDIYINPEDYLGKTIRYEGIFDSYYYEEADMTYYYVIRYGPGCCGFDANAGFEVAWSGDYPDKNDWVEVTGVLEEYEEDGNKYLRLNVSSLTVLDTRGAEYVYQ